MCHAFLMAVWFFFALYILFEIFGTAPPAICSHPSVWDSVLMFSRYEWVQLREPSSDDSNSQRMVFLIQRSQVRHAWVHVRKGRQWSWLQNVAAFLLLKHIKHLLPCLNRFLMLYSERTEDGKRVRMCAACLTEGDRKCSDPCVPGLQVILKCHRIRCYVTAQGTSAIQISSILFACAKCIDRNMTHASVFHGHVNKSTEVPAALQLLQSKLKMFNFFPEESGQI